MKKIVFGILASVLCYGITSCDEKLESGEYTYTLEVPTSIEETEGEVTTTTYYEWNADGSPKAQKQMRGAELVYQDADYTYEPFGLTYRRTYYQDGAAEKVLLIETRYLYTGWTGLYSTKMYSEEGGSKTLVEREENIYTDQLLSGYVHEKDNQKLVERTDYLYGSNSLSYIEQGTAVEGRNKVTITYLSFEYGMMSEVVTAKADDPAVIVSRKKYLYSAEGVFKGYELYEGDTERLIEAQTDYTTTADKITYTTTWYDATGTATRQLKTVHNTTTLTITVVY
ncbi:MAG: hypothetical protein LBM63_02980 [Rikenellaceae bacterium]|jgi:hypothetical protein|nr:hypothetical protein [Rikenellaceae bacterium]